GAAAIALQPLQVRDAGAAQWRTLATDEPFTLAAGMEIRTPLGAMDNPGFGVRGGPAVMLVGMSAVKVTDEGGLQVVDGQTMLDLSRAPQAYTVALNRQKVALQPGAMVLLGVDNGEDYASGGAPAPTLALLHGQAEVVGAANAGALLPGRLYELYDTGTGRFPSRGLSQAESQQRFMPMIDAIRAANERYR
ncbi:MAG: hypothetical protein J6333_03760, partial [Planctomycetes bacterium]|nr:hypothetical protein [Planctomycetota bacterium]